MKHFCCLMRHICNFPRHIKVLTYSMISYGIPGAVLRNPEQSKDSSLVAVTLKLSRLLLLLYTHSLKVFGTSLFPYKEKYKKFKIFYCKMEGAASCILNPGTDSLSGLFRAPATLSPGNDLRYPLNRRLAESTIRFGRCEEQKVFARAVIRIPIFHAIRHRLHYLRSVAALFYYKALKVTAGVGKYVALYVAFNEWCRRTSTFNNNNNNNNNNNSNIGIQTQ